MNNFQLLSPVLYFFSGSIGNDNIDIIKNIQDNLISNNKGIQYISNLSGLPNAHTAFLKTPFNTVGEIRVNFVINTNSLDSQNIDKTIEDAYNFLRLRYTTFVAIDAYCILDESSGNFDTMSVSLNALNSLRKKNILNIVYMLSNINSKGISKDNYKNIFESIAYMPLVLDCAIMKDMQGSWFDERYFKQLSKGLQCYTIGSLSIQKPYKAIYNEVIISIINCFKNNLFANTEAAEYYSKKLAVELNINFNINTNIELEDMFALLENEGANPNNLAGYTNIELIQNIFGDRADDFFNLNITEQSGTVYNSTLNNISKNIKQILDEAVNDPTCGIFGITGIMNYFNKEVSNIKAYYENNLLKSKSELESWQNTSPTITKKTMSLFSKKYILPYETAYAYIKLKASELNQHLTLTLLNETIDIIQGYCIETKQKTDLLETKQNELKSKNQNLLSDQLPVITQNFTNYYKQLTYNYITADPKTAKKLYSNFSVYNDTEIEKSIHEYAKNVVESKPFIKPLVDEINERTSKKQLTYESVIGEKNYNIYLRSGESGKQREICLFTNSSSDFSHYVKEQGVNPGFDKLNIMYGLNKDQIILIYMLGVFSTEDLFYRELYKNGDK